jgi:hypothetical protein
MSDASALVRRVNRRPRASQPDPLRLRSFLQATWRWCGGNVLILAAGMALYTWMFSYQYLEGFYARFDADPEQLGFSRVEETSRTLALVIPTVALLLLVITMAAGAVAWAVAVVSWITGPAVRLLRADKARKVREKRRPRIKPTDPFGGSAAAQLFGWIGTTFAVLFFIAFPFSCADRGFDDANGVLASPKFDVSPSILQWAIGPRVQGVIVTWTMSYGSPFKDSKDTAEVTAYGYLLGESDGVTHFFSTDDCSIYHVPSSLVIVARSVGKPLKEQQREEQQREEQANHKPRSC